MLPRAHGSRKRSTWHPPRAAALQEQALRHLWLHFTPMSGLEAERLSVIERGEGPYVVDTNGKRYLDFLSGLFTVQIGYSHGEELGQAALEQAKQLPYYTNWTFAHPPAIELAAKLAEIAPEGIGRSFFVSGGSEAVEAAIKLAREYHNAGGEPTPPQGHRAQDRVPRHDLRRALADRHHGPAHAVRAADGRRPPRRQHQPVPLQVLRRPGRLQPEAAPTRWPRPSSSRAPRPSPW